MKDLHLTSRHLDRRDFLKTLAAGAIAFLPLARRGVASVPEAKDFTPAYGIVPPLLTPFTSAGAVDFEAYDRLIDWHAARGVSGVFIICSSSESRHLTEDEALGMASAAVRRAKGRIHILAGSTLHRSLSDNIAMTRRMTETGVDGCFITTPRRLPNDGRSLDERMLAYFRRIHDEGRCPVYGYEIPGVYNFSPEVFAELGKLERFIGIKDTSTRNEAPMPEALAAVRAKLAVANGTARVMQANTKHLLTSLQIGCTGGINTAANVAPHLLAKLYHLWHTNDMETAGRVQERINAIDDLMHDGYVLSAKIALTKMGVPMETVCRTDVPDLTAEQIRALDEMVAMIRKAEEEFGVTAND